MMRLFALIFVIRFALPAAGQTFNNRYYHSGDAACTGFSAEQIDGNYYLFGTCSDSLYKISVHILDLNGDVVDQQLISTDSTWLFIGYSNATDYYAEGFVSAGTKKFPEPEYFGKLVKWDENADTLLTRVFFATEGDSMIILNQAKAISDGFVAVGSTRDGVGTENIILLKTDFDLNEVWRRSYGTTTAPLAGYSVVQTPDGGFLLGGVRKIGESWDHCVVKTDSEGVQQYIKYHGNNYYGNYAHVANTADGKYIFGGMRQIGTNDYQSLICKLDTDLDTLWCKTYNTPGPDCFVNSIKSLDDGNLIVCGVDRSDGTMYGYILKIDSDGNEIWYRKYAQTEDNWAFFYDVIQTTDGGYFLAGSLFADPGLTQDIWGLKLDEDGCLVPGCDTADNVFSTRAGVGFSVYPNPSAQFINVYIGLTQALSKGEGVRFELTDLQGRIVKSFSPQLTDATYMLDVEELPAGVYVLSLVVDGVVGHTEKIMKE